MGWFWPSKEEIVQKNLQNHINRVEAEVKTLSALNSTDNNWTQEAINDLGNLNERNNKLLEDLKKNKKTPPAGRPPAGRPPAGTPPAGTLPAGTLPAGTLPAGTLPAVKPDFSDGDLTAGGTRKKRKNKKHKKKTYRH